MTLNLTPAQLNSLLTDAVLEFQRRQKRESATRYDTPEGIVRFVRDVIKADPAPYQERILRALVEHRRVAVRGLHGLGKTALSAWVAIWSLFAFPEDTKTLITASVWRQVSKYTFPEIRKWATHAQLDPRPRILDTSLKMPLKETFGASSDDPYALEGLHATNVVVIMDEAKAIPDPFFDALEGALSTGNTFALMLSTPGESSGRFYDIHARKPGFEDWHVIHVTLAEALAAGRVSQQWADQRRAQWGENSAIYQNRVLGEFADSGEDSVIPLSWVEAANERWYAANGRGEGRTFAGLDVARYGDDSSVLTRVTGIVVEEVLKLPKLDTMETAEEVTKHVMQGDPLAVDVGGLGAGVYDRLKQLHFNAIPVNAATSTTLKDITGQLSFDRLRSALWWTIRDNLHPANPDAIALPPIDELTADLTAPSWSYTTAGRIIVEPKDATKKRLSRSPDFADSLALALYAALHHRHNFTQPRVSGLYEKSKKFDTYRARGKDIILPKTVPSERKV